MNRVFKTLMILGLTCATILLSILYSPIGSPDLYHQRKYFIDNQGVNFNKITIANLPKNRYTSTNSTTELNIQNNGNTHKNLNYAVNSVGNSSHEIGRAISHLNSTITTVNHKSYSSANFGFNSSNGVSGSNINGLSGVTEFSSISRGKTSNSLSQKNHINTSLIDLSLFSDSTSNNINESSRQGIISPGDGDPTGDPIPVGEGCFYLIMLAVLYIVIKNKLAVTTALITKFQYLLIKLTKKATAQYSILNQIYEKRSSELS